MHEHMSHAASHVTNKATHPNTCAKTTFMRGICVLLILASVSAFAPSPRQLPLRPVDAPQPVRRPEVVLIARGGVPDVPFASAYKPAEIAALWTAVKKCYGSEAAARAAISQNNQILCPLYASPSLLTSSQAALVALLGKEEALEIMAKNPAVLTCGAGYLEQSDPSEIRSAANTRQFLDRFVTPEGLSVAVVCITLALVVRLAQA